MSGNNSSSIQTVDTDAVHTAFCQSCKEAFSWLHGEDCMPTALTCGHFLCFKCVKSQWSSVDSSTASVFCVECSDHTRASTFKCSNTATGQAAAAVEGDSEAVMESLGQAVIVQQAGCAGDGTNIAPASLPLPVTPVQAQMTCTPSKQYLTGDHSAASSSGEGRDKVVAQFTSPAGDRLSSHDDTWRLQNEEGFIRDWIVANVPDHVIFKMVGGGNQETPGVSGSDSLIDTGGGVASTTPKAGSHVGVSFTGGGVALPSMASFLGDVAPSQGAESQFWSYVINRSEQGRQLRVLHSSTEEQQQQQISPHIEHPGVRVDKCLLEEGEHHDKEPALLTPQTAHGSPAPSISGIFPHQSGKDIGKPAAKDTMGDGSDCLMDTSTGCQSGNSASLMSVGNTLHHVLPLLTGRPGVRLDEHNVPPQMQQDGHHTTTATQASQSGCSQEPAAPYSTFQHWPSQDAFPSYGAGSRGSHPYHASYSHPDRPAETHLGQSDQHTQRHYSYQGRLMEPSRPGGYYPYSYLYPYSNTHQNSFPQCQARWGFSQQANINVDHGYHFASHSYRHRARGWRPHCATPVGSCRMDMPHPWNSRAFAGSVRLSPQEKVSTPPQLQVVQVVRHRTDVTDQDSGSKDGSEETSSKMDTEASVGQTEAEVALMKTRAMPSGTKVEDIYVVPQVWLCDQVDTCRSDDGSDLLHQPCGVAASIAVRDNDLVDSSHMLVQAGHHTADGCESGVAGTEGREGSVLLLPGSEQVNNASGVEVPKLQSDSQHAQADPVSNCTSQSGLSSQQISASFHTDGGLTGTLTAVMDAEMDVGNITENGPCQKTPDVAMVGDVQIVEEGSTQPSQILLSLQNPAESPRKPRYRRNLTADFQSLNTDMPSSSSETSAREYALLRVGHGRWPRKGRIRRGPYFGHHTLHNAAAQSVERVGSYSLLRNQAQYSGGCGYHQGSANSSFQDDVPGQMHVYQSFIRVPGTGQQAFTYPHYRQVSGANQAGWSADFFTQYPASVPCASQYPYQRHSLWMGETQSYSGRLTDPYPHLYFNSGKSHSSAMSSTLPHRQFENSALFLPEQPHVSGLAAGPSKTVATATSENHLNEGTSSMPSQKQSDDGGRPGDADNNVGDMYGGRPEMSACGDTGQTNVQEHISCEGRGPHHGSAQWLLQQVTYLSERLVEAPDLHQLLGCLMLLSAVSSSPQDGSRPVDPSLNQQAKGADMDCLFKCIMGLGYDVVSCGRAMCVRQQSEHPQDKLLGRAREITCLVGSWFQYVVQQMTSMISIYLDHLCAKKRDMTAALPVTAEQAATCSATPGRVAAQSQHDTKHIAQIETSGPGGQGSEAFSASGSSPELLSSVPPTLTTASCVHSNPSPKDTSAACLSALAERDLENDSLVFAAEIHTTDHQMKDGLHPMQEIPTAAATIGSDAATCDLARDVFQQKTACEPASATSAAVNSSVGLISPCPTPVCRDMSTSPMPLLSPASAHLPLTAIQNEFNMDNTPEFVGEKIVGANLFVSKECIADDGSYLSSSVQSEHVGDLRRGQAENESAMETVCVGVQSRSRHDTVSCMGFPAAVPVTTVFMPQISDSYDTPTVSCEIDSGENVCREVLAVCNSLVDAVSNMNSDDMHHATLNMTSRSPEVPVILSPAENLMTDFAGKSACVDSLTVHTKTLSNNTVKAETKDVKAHRSPESSATPLAFKAVEVQTDELTKTDERWLETDGQEQEEDMAHIKGDETERTSEPPAECSHWLRSRRAPTRSGYSDEFSPEKPRATRNRRKAFSKKSQCSQTA